MNRKRTLKDSLWEVLNDQDDWRYVWFHRFINILILVSVVIVVWQELGTPPEEHKDLIDNIDRVILFIFFVEFVARLWVIRAFLPRAVRLTPTQKFSYWGWSNFNFDQPQ